MSAQIFAQIVPNTQYTLAEYSNHAEHEIVTLTDLCSHPLPNVFDHLIHPYAFYNEHGVRYGYHSLEGRVQVDLDGYVDGVLTFQWNFHFAPNLPFLDDDSNDATYAHLDSNHKPMTLHMLKFYMENVHARALERIANGHQVQVILRIDTIPPPDWNSPEFARDGGASEWIYDDENDVANLVPDHLIQAQLTHQLHPFETSTPDFFHGCSICTGHNPYNVELSEELGVDDSSFPVSIPCSHHFHFHCLNSWFVRSLTRTCPNCRALMPPFTIPDFDDDLSIWRLFL